MAQGYINITCGNCGATNDIEEWTTRNDVPLPPEQYQCPNCNITIERIQHNDGSRSTHYAFMSGGGFFLPLPEGRRYEPFLLP